MPDYVIIHVPFRSKESFTLIKVIPFPSVSGNSTSVILDGVFDYLLVQVILATIASSSPRELELCMSLPASFVPFYPLNPESCRARMASGEVEGMASKCRFREVNQREIVPVALDGHYYYLCLLLSLSLWYVLGLLLLLYSECPQSFPFSHSCSFSDGKRQTFGFVNHFLEVYREEVLESISVVITSKNTLVPFTQIEKLPRYNSNFHSVLESLQFVPSEYAPHATSVVIITVSVLLVISLVLVIGCCLLHRKFSTIVFPTPVLDMNAVRDASHRSPRVPA